MSLLTILRAAGNDLSHIGTWIEDGLKSVGPLLGVLDPPLAPIINEVEVTLQDLQTTTKLPISSATIQAVATSVATLAAIRLPAGTLASLISGVSNLTNPPVTTTS